MPDEDDRAPGLSTPVRRQIIMEPESGAHFPSNTSQIIPGLRLDYNRFDQEWQEELGMYVPRDSKPTNALNGTAVTDTNQYAFSIVRHYQPSHVAKEQPVDTWIHFWSSYWIKAAEKVMSSVRGVLWTITPLIFSPELLLSFLNGFEKYLADLEVDPSIPDAELIIEHVEFFIRFMRLEYRDSLRQLEGYLTDGMIPWDMLWGLYTPGQHFRYEDWILQKPHIGRLLSAGRANDPNTNEEYYKVGYEYLERGADGSVGWVDDWIRIDRYPGAVNIQNLRVVPLDRVSDAEVLKDRLLARAKKWYQLKGSQCMVYDGFGHRQDRLPSGELGSDYTKVKVKSRVMIDRGMYTVHGGGVTNAERSMDGQSLLLAVQPENPEKKETETTDSQPEPVPPPDDILVMAPAYVFGLALSSKEWLLFDAEDISDIQWNQDAFKNLSLPPDQKQLIKALVESHSQTKNSSVDDFVEGKGRGLIISLFGPPGVGKTLTAEATSELTRRPLYVVGAGEIGKSAIDLEDNLRRIFSTTSSWKAIVLIDEADVFLEKRSTTNLDRNAIVAVLLRQLEYFPGILFLTTNRQIMFDEALQSRIHVSLHYPALTPVAKEQIWVAFLKRAKIDTEAWTTKGTIRRLRDLPINGREIKNTVNTASVLARHKKEELEERHIWQVIKTNIEYGADAARRSAARVANQRRYVRAASFLSILALVAVLVMRFFMMVR